MLDLGLCVLVSDEAQLGVVALLGWEFPVSVPLDVWKELVMGELCVRPGPRACWTSRLCTHEVDALLMIDWHYRNLERYPRGGE